jgi:dTDP-4-dehydrorhamnose reductase
LGANLVAIAHQQGWEVVGVSYRHAVPVGGVRHLQVDLTQPAAAEDLLATVQPDWVVHCAALTDVDWCEEHPGETERVNVEMSAHLARAARQQGSRFVFISTDAVFDGARGWYEEDDPPAPINVYAKSKWAAETVVRSVSASSLIVRTTFYGWHLQTAGLSLGEWIISRLESHQLVSAFVDVIFSPLLVTDLGAMLLAMMERKLQGVYHVAASEACSKYAFAVQVAEVFGLDRRLVQPTSVNQAGLRAPRPGNTSLQTHKVCRASGVRMPDVRSGIERFQELRAVASVVRAAG